MVGEDIEVGGHTYRLGKLSAMDQFHVTRRIMPIVSQLGGGDALAKIMAAVGELSDADSEYVIYKCLSGAKRKQDGERGWAAVCRNNQLMFDDMGMDALLRLTWATIEGNMADFFTGLRSGLTPAAAE